MRGGLALVVSIGALAGWACGSGGAADDANGVDPGHDAGASETGPPPVDAAIADAASESAAPAIDTMPSNRDRLARRSAASNRVGRGSSASRERRGDAHGKRIGSRRERTRAVNAGKRGDGYAEGEPPHDTGARRPAQRHTSQAFGRGTAGVGHPAHPLTSSNRGPEGPQEDPACGA